MAPSARQKDWLGTSQEIAGVKEDETVRWPWGKQQHHSASI